MKRKELMSGPLQWYPLHQQLHRLVRQPDVVVQSRSPEVSSIALSTGPPLPVQFFARRRRDSMSEQRIRYLSAGPVERRDALATQSRTLTQRMSSVVENHDGGLVGTIMESNSINPSAVQPGSVGPVEAPEPALQEQSSESLERPHRQSQARQQPVMRARQARSHAMGLADPRAIQLSRRRVLLRPAAQALLRARCRVHRSHQEAV